ncbi:hypothetical protein SDC9_197063 [bioreactor metagenome]|uniref:Uncharacterized protein n=1 Tax=bioreactor metagenome TaxID=1076179 RepID=A0A645IF28_9ZZZZ
MHFAILALGKDAFHAELPREFIGDDHAAHRRAANLRNRQVFHLFGHGGEDFFRQRGEAEELCALAIAAAVPPGGEEEVPF